MSTFHGLPVQEAQANIYLRAVEEDGGTPGDPFACRWANAAHRMYGGLAAFFRTVAFIEVQPGVVMRFAPKVQLPDGTLVNAGKRSAYRHGIDQFDETGVMPNVDALVFGPHPRPLSARSAENARRHEAARAAGAKRPPRERHRTSTGTGNGQPATAVARGGYIPSQHR